MEVGSGANASVVKAIPVTEESQALARKAVHAIEGLIASKLGKITSFGESEIKLRWQNGQLTTVVVRDEAVIK